MICTRVSSRRGKSQAFAGRLPIITWTTCEKMHTATSTLRAVAAVRNRSCGPAAGNDLYPLIVFVPSEARSATTEPAYVASVGSQWFFPHRSWICLIMREYLSTSFNHVVSEYRCPL